MNTKDPLNGAVILVVMALSACSGSSNDPIASTSELSPTELVDVITGEPGGDTTAIAGLWNGTNLTDDINDVVYWNLAADGVLTRYDYQQDGLASATGENCYIVDPAITVTPEGGESYSIFDVAVSALRDGNTLTITFDEADKNDLNGNGDTTESPVLSWALLSTPTLDDLNACVIAGEGSSSLQADDTLASELPVTAAPAENPTSDSDILSEASDIPPLAPPGSDSMSANLPAMTRAQCRIEGGIVIGDIGNGAIYRADYRCESGASPIAVITYLEGDPIATDGEVCCV